MKVHKEIPHRRHLALFVVVLTLDMGLSYAPDSGMPVWGVHHFTPIASVVFVLILGSLYAMVSYYPWFLFLIQMVGGALILGEPIADMCSTLCTSLEHADSPACRLYTI